MLERVENVRHWRMEQDQAGILWLTLDRAESGVNALSAEVLEELERLLPAIARSRAKGLVLRSGKAGGFIAGADVNEFAERTSSVQALAHIRRGQEIFRQVELLPMPTVAMIHGFCLGGGLELALCADFRVLGESVKVGQPEILLGVIPGAGGTQRLPRLIGPSRAKDLVFSGRFIDAAEALRIGLADQVVPDAEVYDAARRLTARYTGGAPLALRAAKQAIDDGLERDLDAGLEIERLNFTGLFATEDQKTGMHSFLENGPGKATFSGR